jgi:hypothetical protein
MNDRTHRAEAAATDRHNAAAIERHQQALRDYSIDHVACPKCLRKDTVARTLAGSIHQQLVGAVLKDQNHATCDCGWTGIVHDMVPDPTYTRKAPDAVRVAEDFKVHTISIEPGSSISLDTGASLTAGKDGLTITAAPAVVQPGQGPVLTTIGEADHSRQLGMIGDASGPSSLQDVEHMLRLQQQIDAANGVAFGKILDILNVALSLDREAVSKLLRTRAPINDCLSTTTADILTGHAPSGMPDMSVLGLLNSCLQAGLNRRLAALVGDGPEDKIILGLSKWDPPSQQADVPSLDEPAPVDTVSKPIPLND